MIFTLYSVTATNHFRYEYEINGLVGTHDDSSLPNLLEVLRSSTDLIYNQLYSLEYYTTDTYLENVVIVQIFQNTYDTIWDLYSNIVSDLRTALPEHFI